MRAELDETDLRILDTLQKDSRMPYTEVAKRLSVSDGMVHVRVRKMREAGVIKGNTIVVDPEKVGKEAKALLLVKVAPGRLEYVLGELVKVDSVYEAHEVHGQYDVELKVREAGIPEMRETLVRRIRSVDGVTSVEALTVYKTWKEQYTPVPVIKQKS